MHPTGKRNHCPSSWSHEFVKTNPPVPVEVAAKAPVFTESTGKYTIPATPGIQYYVNGTSQAAGTYDSGWGTISVTASVQDKNYKLTGTSQWSHTFVKPAPHPSVKSVATKAPAFNTSTGKYTIPAVTGVQYLVNNKVVKAGTYTASRAALTVTAKAAGGYGLTGTTSWNYDFRTKVTAAAPTFTKSTGKYTIPNRAGVQYLVNNKAVRAGTYSGGKTTVTVTAKAASSAYLFSGTSSWKYSFAPTKVTAAAPSFNAKTKKYTIPATTGVTYWVGGKTIKKGTYSGKNKNITVTATAKTGYVLSATKTWKYEFRTKVTAAKPSFSASKGTYNVPSKPGVTYYVNGKTAKKGTFKGNKKTVTITAKAKTGYVLSGTSKWSYRLQK